MVTNEVIIDGDFRSAEVKALRDEADIICTNPPFSLFRDFLAWIDPDEKKFLILGNMNAITYKEVFPLIRDNKLWLGASSGSIEYSTPNGTIQKMGNTCWFTNLNHRIRREELQLLTKAVREQQGVVYQKYDNYDAIEVPETKLIPSDYDGVMGVPISFLDKYNPDQFEIVAFRKGEDGRDLVFTREREREFNRTIVSLFDGDPGNDQERRRRNKWQDYLRENPNTTKEPVDFFYPSRTSTDGVLNTPDELLINGTHTYKRLLIKNK